jgi:hypothetical protein
VSSSTVAAMVGRLFVVVESAAGVRPAIVGAVVSPAASSTTICTVAVPVPPWPSETVSLAVYVPGSV